MKKNTTPHQEVIHIPTRSSAQHLAGVHDENLSLLEEFFSVHLTLRGEDLVLKGEKSKEAKEFIEGIRSIWKNGHALSRKELEEALELYRKGKNPVGFMNRTLFHTASGHPVKAKTQKQLDYIEAIEAHDLTLGIGPAGTGKTYLAVAMAVHALKNKTVQRIILTRPVVEAGERLGFLPGGIQEKVDPYFRPLYDALFDMLESEKFQKLMDKGIVEIAPLAYMRGRTLNDAFIILDEAQNATFEQLKMFMTRMGFGSKMVITGDPTQTDLPQRHLSGLENVLHLLTPIPGVGIVRFSNREIIRHPMVQKIVEALEKKLGPS